MSMRNRRPPSILVIDDDIAILKLLHDYLRAKGYEVRVAKSGRSGIEEVSNRPFDCILLDIMMPGEDGFEVLKYFKTHKRYHEIPVVMMTIDKQDQRRRCYELGSDDFIRKPLDFVELEIRIRSLVRIKGQTDKLRKRTRALKGRDERIRQQNRDLQEANLDSIFMLAAACEARDGETGQHVRRIQHYTAELCKALNLPADEVDDIAVSSMLHDVGKVRVPDAVLKYPGKLNTQKWEIMKKHTIYGYDLLTDRPFFYTARLVARHHHERWDGRGYPDGLQGEAIPLCARLTTLADVYDALTHKRVYKRAWTEEEAIAEMVAKFGTAYDPGLKDVFLRLVEDGTFMDIREKYRDMPEVMEIVESAAGA